MQLITARKNDLKQLKKLYKEAFPKEERYPFFLIQKRVKQGKAEILALEEDGFAGLAIMMFYKDIAMLQFFAVSPDKRGNNLGSTTLKLLKERYAGKRLLIEIETLVPEANNYADRVRRKSFYLRNGMKEMHIAVLLFGVELELLTDGEDVSFEEYHAMYTDMLGHFIADRKVLFSRKL